MLHPAHAVPLKGEVGHGIELFATLRTNDRLVVLKTTDRDKLARAAGEATRLAAGDASLKGAAGALVIYCGGCAMAVGAERLPVAVGEIAKGLGGVPFATQFTYGEMGPSGFAAEEGEARVEDEQCNLMLNLLVFGREPQAE